MTEPEDAVSLPISDRMQALLAQAAEDQLSEQRQLAEALEDLRAQMSRVTADVAALREQQAEPSGRVDTAVGALSNEVRDAVGLINERLDGLARMVHQRGLDLAELRGSFAELRTTVGTHGDTLAGMTGGLDSLPSYGERVADLQRTVDALNERLGGLDEVRAAVGDVDQRVGATADALAEVRGFLDELRQRTDSPVSAGDLEATAGQVAALSIRIEELAATTTPLAERLSAMQESIALETERNARLAEQLGELADRLEEAAGTAAAARSDSAALSARIDALQEDVTAIGANVTGLVEAGPDPAELQAALDAARHAGDQVGRVNEIAVQVAEVRAALLGDDGLEGQVAALSDRMSVRGDGGAGGPDEGTHAMVSEAVAREVAASEQRLSQHLDEAMLALAEVLLRRRGRGGASTARAVLSDYWAPTSGEMSEAAVSEAALSEAADSEAADSKAAASEAGVAATEESPEQTGWTAAPVPFDGSGPFETSGLPADEAAGEAERASGWLDDEGEAEGDDDLLAPWDRDADQPVPAGAAQPLEPSESPYSEPPVGSEWAASAEAEVASGAAEPEQSEQPEQPEEPQRRKRRPWWRPGD